MAEEKVLGQAAEAGTDNTKKVSGQAIEQVGTGETAKGTEVIEKQPYTPEELEALHPMEIDLERVEPASRPIVEKTVTEYKALQGTYTKASQELAELKRTEKPSEPVRYFTEPKKDEVFKQYLKEPLKVITEINAEIVRLSGIKDDVTNPDYETAAQNIAYWSGVKDEFFFKKDEISNLIREMEILDAKINVELGENTEKIREYARNLGLSNVDFRKPQLRASIIEMYKLANAGKSADGKEIKPKAPKLAGAAGAAGGGTGQKPITEVTDMNEYASRRGLATDRDRQYK